MRKWWVISLVGMVVTGGVLSAKPNKILVLLVDDWGWTDGGVFGSDLYETPNIDQLANDGLRFTDAYAACTVCSPTRAALLTGLYPARLRVTDWIDGHTQRFENTPMLEPDWTTRLEHERVTLAEVLRKHGFRTASVGKWHLTPKSEPGAPEERQYLPESHGFEINIAGNQRGMPGSYFHPFFRDPFWQRNLPDAKEGDYLTDVLTEAAVELIESWKDEPFMIYFPYYTVHTPIQRMILVSGTTSPVISRIRCTVCVRACSSGASS